jgi:hypothetical protein
VARETRALRFLRPFLMGSVTARHPQESWGSFTVGGNMRSQPPNRNTARAWRVMRGFPITLRGPAYLGASSFGWTASDAAPRVGGDYFDCVYGSRRN